MRSPVPTDGLVQRIINQPAPVIFLDTAAILDVARVPYREDLDLKLISCAEKLSSGANQAWVVTTGNVVRELNDNRLFVETELNKEMKRFERLAKVEVILFPEDPPRLSSRRDKDVAKRALETMDRLVEVTHVFQGSRDCTLRAADRVRDKHRPSSAKKQEFKDCEIFEEFLELASRLRVIEFAQPIVFVTSNVSDYGPVPDGHPRIKEDLAQRSAIFAANLSHAASLIQIQPT